MNLVIDQGNTFNKIGVFDKGQLEYSYSSKSLDENTLKQLQVNYPIKNVIISSVRDKVEQSAIFNGSEKVFGSSNILLLDTNTPVPFKNEYLSPQTLGKDRIAALAGAYNLFPDNPKLIIDAGTAITIDYLRSDNVFNGGNISPGLQTRFNSLKQNTGKLPLLELNNNSPFLGQNTQEAIWSGVQNSLIFEIEGYINHFKTLNSNTKTILTGGDVDFFANNLKNRIFVIPNLVLTGLNTILDYNA
ncbi:type III pantothenate kinase [Saccharicrinis aurantiacus]|uniref:type III pantothenate kinase n=1 Tax=Saccharicrinis aurantiacus TaxID=1849719 RepID=UPI000839755B|nr:type III pantothenate kinase [Saccharicrinis aurantiacus]